MCPVPRCSCYTHHLGPWFRYGVGIIFFTWPCKLKTHTHKRESRAHIQWNRSRRWKRKKQADPKKLGKWERVIGLAVDGVLEACVKPGALTAGFKGRGEGYGLESGLLLHIFWRLNSYPPPPTPLWTSGASSHFRCLWVFQQRFTDMFRCRGGLAAELAPATKKRSL